ncbi:alpha/beta hydrolase [Mastigocladopsis repens]|uniref:alpha/beta hydrolase n=1 Tax=Mastigocladopsis repens TaxID=221287 RepID=UPI0002E8D3AE
MSATSRFASTRSTEQHEDFRNAITWTQLQSEVDPERIGLWGFSYSGGHALHLAAFDPRVKAIVAQMPTVNAFLISRRLTSHLKWRNSQRCFHLTG